MKIPLICGLGLLSLLTACQRDPVSETIACTYPQRIVADSACYAGKGLKLSALDYGTNTTNFEWTVAALKDTVGSWGWNPDKDVKMVITGPDNIIVPDSILSAYQRLIVKAAANCAGTPKYSAHFGFVQKKSATQNCFVWVKPTSY